MSNSTGTPDDMQQGLTDREAAKEIGVNRSSIWRWSKNGHPALAGQSLRYRTGKRHIAGRGWIRVRLYDRDDLHAIRDFLNSAGPANWDGLTVGEAAREIGVSKISIMSWAKEGHAALDGGRLRYRVGIRDTARHGRRKVRLYSRDDLHAIREFNPTTGSSDNEGLTLGEAVEEIGVDKSAICRWAKEGHGALNGHCLRYRVGIRDIAGHGRRKVRLYNRDDLHSIREVGTTNVLPNRDGLTLGEAAKEIGVSETSIWTWGKKGHLALGGRCLASRIEMCHIKGRGWGKVRLYNRDDLNAIRDFRSGGAKTDPPATDPDATSDPTKRYEIVEHERGLLIQQQGDRADALNDREESPPANGGMPAATATSPNDGPADAAAHNGTPPRKPGRPNKSERDRHIRQRAKAEGLMRQPAELTRRLNADEEFVSRWGKVTNDAVKKVLNRSKKRCQKS